LFKNPVYDSPSATVKPLKEKWKQIAKREKWDKNNGGK